MKKVVILVLTLLFVVLAVSFTSQRSASDAIPRQVIAIAPTDKNARILAVDDHISNAPRPEESYIFPIALGEVGPIKPLYAGSLQYPFFCNTHQMGLGQALVDNQQGYGMPVYREINGEITEDIEGYSKDCLIPAQLKYSVLSAENKLSAYSGAPLQEGEQLMRIEHGSINRFVYTLMMPVQEKNHGERLTSTLWNKRLIYHFGGGGGIGFRQGRQKFSKLARYYGDVLHEGYALITSTGNRTSYTYNMLLAEDTARRVKQQFISLYGEPSYTVGIGGSGGGLAQYLLAQNVDDLLDALIPLYSYPDMVSQSLYALDCDLLNNYYHYRAQDPGRWDDYALRQKIEGLNGLNGLEQRFGFLQPANQLYSGRFPSLPKGNSECINGWFGTSTYLNNPHQGFLKPLYSQDVVKQVHWSYWQDLVQIYGTDQRGFARSTFDNQGVQYGLEALKKSIISIDEFFDINKKIGGWVPQYEMQKEVIWAPFGKKMPLWLTLWSRHNVTAVNKGVASRSIGDKEAIEAAYRYGQVFIGKVDLPILDVRHYREESLDMHHISASFSSRLRLQNYNGHADNHVIWISHKDDMPVSRAFEAMDRWMEQKQQGLGKPENIQDTCFNHIGEVMNQGEGVWDGRWNNKSKGKCMRSFPSFSNSRIAAGGVWQGSIFVCHRISTEEAIAQGIYGNIDMEAYRDKLKHTFAGGVCDYSLGDKARPKGLGTQGQK